MAQDQDAAANLPATAGAGTGAGAGSPSRAPGVAPQPQRTTTATVTRTILRSPSVLGRRFLRPGPTSTTAAPATTDTTGTPETTVASPPPSDVALADSAATTVPVKAKAPSPVAASRTGVQGDSALDISPTFVALMVALALAALAVWVDRRPR